MINTEPPQNSIISGLDYILSHFHNQELWPRTISTKATEGRQILVNSKEEAIARFVKANYLDCRISAYPPNMLENPSAIGRFQGLRIVTPRNIIVIIDLDKCNFKTEKALVLALTKLNDRILTYPYTVIWSGKGYHIYLALDSEGIILENIKDFTDLEDNVSLKFLRFAELFLSNGKSDKAHNTTVSYNNSMMRIPGSYNSKNNVLVRIIRRWDTTAATTTTPAIKPLLRDFRRYLIDQSIIRKQDKARRKANRRLSNSNNDEIAWIERLLQTPLADYRKYCIWRILAPYLLNIKKLPEQETTDIIKNWLDQCNKLRRLDFNYNPKIKDGIEGAVEGYLPISLAKLKDENGGLYFLLQDRG